MGYRIAYQSVQRKSGFYRSNFRVLLLTLLCFCLFLVLVLSEWTDGASLLQHAAFGSDGTVVVSALNELTEQLHTGEKIERSVAEFLRKILQ